MGEVLDLRRASNERAIKRSRAEQLRWMLDRRWEAPYWASGPNTINPVEVRHVRSAVLVDGRRTFAFFTEAHRQEFLANHPGTSETETWT